MKARFQFLFFCLLLPLNAAQAQVYFQETSPYEVQSLRSGATWQEDLISGGFTYNSNGTNYQNRALLYSSETFQSDDGFKLTIEYTTGSIGDSAAHNFSFGLISDETDLSHFDGFNPFKTDLSIYSIGANLTADGDATARGINFTRDGERTTLDQSGTRVQFATGTSTKVTIEIGIGGYWSYRINDEYEASGVLVDEIDLSKNYHVVVYGQDDNGGGKSIQSITLENRYAVGERADKLRGTWASVDHDAVEQLKDFKTLDTLYVRFNNGATGSAKHLVPSKLLERLALEGYDGNDDPIDLIGPSWGDLSLDEPESDAVHDQMLAIRAAGFRVKAYLNAEQFIGTNAEIYEDFTERWKEYCDSDPEAQAFINSQTFHTGTWNSSTEEYDDATDTYPNRKYLFCYAEFVLKDFALRYGDLIDSWIFDSAADISSNGDSATSGVIEQQRIYQAFVNAVHAGNPEIAIAFNNGRSTSNYPSYPFAAPIRFEDFTFGHAFGGNNNHAEKESGNQFNLNYQHITRMIETNGYVHAAGRNDWDELIVGNFHSKLGTGTWAYSPTQAWEQDDFNQWNLEALQAGGTMTWSGSAPRVRTDELWTYAYDQLKATDDYLAEHQNPGAPNWARAFTILPAAYYGEPYSHTLVEDIDFWDPEGDQITDLFPTDHPSWLNIQQTSPGVWTFSGTPTEPITTEYDFSLTVSDASGETSRNVNLTVINANPLINSTKGTWVPAIINLLLEEE
jgi:hypothetical protein